MSRYCAWRSAKTQPHSTACPAGRGVAAAMPATELWLCIAGPTATRPRWHERQILSCSRRQQGGQMGEGGGGTVCAGAKLPWGLLHRRAQRQAGPSFGASLFWRLLVLAPPCFGASFFWRLLVLAPSCVAPRLLAPPSFGASFFWRLHLLAGPGRPLIVHAPQRVLWAFPPSHAFFGRHRTGSHRCPPPPPPLLPLLPSPLPLRPPARQRPATGLSHGPGLPRFGHTPRSPLRPWQIRVGPHRQATVWPGTHGPAVRGERQPVSPTPKKSPES